jgi:transcription termination/antitermination protein NusA
MKGKELLLALELLEKEKKISKDIIIEGIKEALDRAYKKEIDPDSTIEVDFDKETGVFSIFNIMKVVKQEDLQDDMTEITLEDARKIDVSLGLGDDYRRPIPFTDYSRMAAMQVKQVIKQKISEAQKVVVYDAWAPKIGTIISAQVEKYDEANKTAVIDLGNNIFGFITSAGMVPGEYLKPGRTYMFYVQDVKQTSKGWPIILSRSAPGFVKYLLTVEIPEIQDGTIDIVSVSRNAGDRTKIAVKANNEFVDPIGSIVGKKGSRLASVSSQIKNEKIDVVLWDEDPIKFIVNALSPAQVYGVAILENNEKVKDAYVIVPDDQLSLAIGKKGSAAKLSAQLTGWNLDIKSRAQALEDGIEYEENGNANQPRKVRNQNIRNDNRPKVPRPQKPSINLEDYKLSDNDYDLFNRDDIKDLDITSKPVVEKVEKEKVETKKATPKKAKSNKISKEEMLSLLEKKTERKIETKVIDEDEEKIVVKAKASKKVEGYKPKEIDYSSMGFELDDLKDTGNSIQDLDELDELIEEEYEELYDK